MKSYVMATGAIFALLVAVHVWRFVEEGPHLAGDPWFWLITLLAAAFGIWGIILLRGAKRS